MARPKTLSRPVAFRLPPEWHEKLNNRALRSGKPLAVYVREEMVDRLRNQDARDRKKLDSAKTNGD